MTTGCECCSSCYKCPVNLDCPDAYGYKPKVRQKYYETYSDSGDMENADCFPGDPWDYGDSD